MGVDWFGADYRGYVRPFTVIVGCSLLNILVLSSCLWLVAGGGWWMLAVVVGGVVVGG